MWVYFRLSLLVVHMITNTNVTAVSLRVKESVIIIIISTRMYSATKQESLENVPTFDKEGLSQDWYGISKLPIWEYYYNF